MTIGKKAWLLTLLLAAVFTLQLYAQFSVRTVEEVTIGAGDQLARIPVDMYWKNSLFECLYYPEELGFVGEISAISFYNSFNTNLPNMPTKIWLGTTTQNDLSGGWIPSTQLSLVFDGVVSYPNGTNTITIEFTEPYLFSGNNLVMMVNRPMDSQYYSSSDGFYCQTIGTIRALNSISDSNIYDPANPPPSPTLSGQLPKTKFRFTPTGIYSGFTAEPLLGNSPLTVNFSDRSFIGDNPIISWQWDFENDGVVDSNEQNPFHVYYDAGLYSVSLIVNDGINSHTRTKFDYIRVLDLHTVYFNDFSTTVGSEWSDTTIATAPSGGEKFLGRFNNHNISYSTSNIPAHTRITVEFDLYVIDSWDGVEPWTMSIDGEPIIHTTFAENDVNRQAYPDNIPASYPARTGASLITEFGFSYSWTDAVYHICKTVEHTGSSLALNYLGENLSEISDESWGIDNILITYSDQPIPHFSVSEHSGQLPFTVNFMDASVQGLAPITTWAWDFDSNGTIDSNLQNPSWTYTQPGNYDVTLTVGDGSNTVTGTLENIIHVENSTLADGLVGYYPFSGNANDQSGRGNDGTTFGTTLTEDRYGRPDSAYYFGGDGDYISISETFIMHQPGDASFSLWLKRMDEGYRGIFWTRGDFSDTNRYNVYCGEDRQGFEIDYRDPDGGLHMNALNNHDAVAPVETWTHIVVSRIGNNYLIYENGSLVKTDVDPNPYLPTTTGAWGIGNWASGFYGSMDDIRFYNRALFSTEIQRLYAMDSQSIEPLCRFSATPTSGVRPMQVQFSDESVPGMNPITSWAWDLNGDGQIESTLQNPIFIYPRPGTYSITLTVSDGSYSNTLTKTDLINVESSQSIPTDGLVAYYPLDGNANDESGNNLNGTVSGLVPTTDRFGETNKALWLDGVYDYISIPSQNSSTISVSFWYQLNTTNTGANVILSQYGTNNDHLLYWYDDFIIGDYSPSYGMHDSGTILQNNALYHIVLMKSGTNTKLYLNNSLVWHVSNSFDNAAGPLDRIGNCAEQNEGAMGIYDDVRIYNRELTPSEIQALYEWNPNAPISLSIIAPSLNDRWMVGSYQNIEWVIPDTYTNITLESSIDNGDTWTEIVRSVPANQYTYSWMVPDTPSETCKIRIKDRATPVVLYESEVFDIYRPVGDLAQGLLAYYPFDGNALDISGNERHGNVFGMIPYADRFGNESMSLKVDDHYDSVIIPDVNGHVISVSLWYYFDGTNIGFNNWNVVLSNNRTVPAAYDHLAVHYNTHQLGFYANGWYPSGYALQQGNWYHLVMMKSYNSLQIYANNVLVMNVDYSFDNAAGPLSVIGNVIQNGNEGALGVLDDVRIYNRLLSTNEIENLYQSNLSNLLSIIDPADEFPLISGSMQDIFWYAENIISTVDIEFSGDNGSTWQMLADNLPAQQYHYNWTVPDTSSTQCKLRITGNTGDIAIRRFTIAGNSLEAGLVGYYPFTGNANDQSGRGNDGTTFNTTLTEDRYGCPNSAYFFEGDGDYISIPETFVMHYPGDASFSLWLKRNDTVPRGIFWTRNDLSDTNRYNVYSAEDGQGFEIDYRAPDGSLHMNAYNHDAVVPVGSWTNVVVVRDENIYSIYVNGVLVNTNTDTNPNIPNYMGSWSIGNWNGGFYGSMDDIRFYNRALTPSDVEQLYTNGESVLLSGRITGSNAPDTGLGGVQVTLGDNLMSTDTDGNGNFSFAGLSTNSQYRLRLAKDGYATQAVFISIPNYNYDLGTFTLYENTNVPVAVMATQVSEASSASIDWLAAARSTLQAEATEQGRAFLSYSLYRLLAGEEQNPAAWTLIITQTELSYSDAAWYGVPFGVYKYAVANNYSNSYQGVAVFSNELQRRNYTYSENFDHDGATAPGWTVTHNSGSTTTHPWMPVLDSGTDYSYKVLNSNLSTANETLLSPPYNCSRYEKVSVSFWHSYVPNVNSQARFQYSINGVTWTTLFTYTSVANSGIKTYDISTAANHLPGVRFRWIYTATSYNTNSWTIDDFSVYGYTAIPVYLANPHPTTGRKVNNRTVELGITYTDDDMVNAASLAYRLDANGNGAYDAAEDWIAITGYSNAPQINVRVQAVYQTDGDNLRYEFKGADLAGGTVKYSGSNHAMGIADDYSVDIDTMLPSELAGFNIQAAAAHSVTLGWQPVTEAHFAAYEIYYGTHRGVSLASNKWSVGQDAALAELSTASTTITTLNAGINYWFRIRALDLHGNACALSEPLLFVTADLAPVISAPLPADQPLSAWSDSRTVTIGCTFADYYGIDPASVQYRYDRNGNGVYDSDEGWIGVRNSLGVRNSDSSQVKKPNQSSATLNPALMNDDELELYMRNRNQMVVAVPVTFESDGPELRFEFKATDVHGVGPVYTGFYEQAGIEDDWFVRIDSVNPTDIASIYIGVVNPSAIEVAWTRSQDQYFQSYEVYYATHPEVTTTDSKWDWTDDNVLAYMGGDIVVTNVTGLSDNTRYYFRVRAIDEAGNTSPLSNEVSAFYGTSSPPALPQNLQIQLQGDDVILSWDAVTEDSNGNPITVTGYNIYASDLPDVVADIGYLIDTSTTNAYIHLGITPFVDKIFYIVTAVAEGEVRSFAKPHDQRLRTK